MRENWQDLEGPLDKRALGVGVWNDARVVNGAICYVAESNLAGVQVPLIP